MHMYKMSKFFMKFNSFNKILSLLFNRDGFSYQKLNGMFKYGNYYFPIKASKNVFAILTLFDYKYYIWKKYTSLCVDCFRGIDTLIDCGSFVGGLSVFAAERGYKVYAFEPSPRNYKALLENTKKYSNISIFNTGLGGFDAIEDFYLTKTGVDDSFYTPDVEVERVEKVAITTLNKFVLDNNINTDTLWVKVEAEGSELEVLEGMKSIRPSIITIDISPERSGMFPIDKVCELFSSSDYSFFSNKKVLILKRK
jgi:FkbM family methyltransferase